MKIFIELWKAKDAWKEMSLEDRQNYVAQIGPVMQDMIKRGVVIEAWGLNEDTSEHRADFHFFGITKFPTPELLAEFEAIVEGANWYNYFEQVNITGTVLSPDEVIQKMLEQ